MNECIFYGTVYNPPRTRWDSVNPGNYFVKFSLALRSRSKGRWYVDYIDIFAFMRKADIIIEKLSKGSKVCCVCYVRTKFKKLDDGTWQKQVFFVLRRIYFIRDTYKKRDEYFDNAAENVFTGELGRILVDCNDDPNDSTASEADRKELINAEANLFMAKTGLLGEANKDSAAAFDEISAMIDTLEREAGGGSIV